MNHDPFKNKSWLNREDDNSVLLNGGEITVGRNHGSRSGKADLQVYIEVTEGDDRAGAALSTEDARELLDHLNDLLGKPLGIAPSAG